MLDTTILGNGKSKAFKAPSDMPATYDEFRTAAQAGQAYFDVSLNADGCSQVGTALNKNNFLKDTTATEYKVYGDLGTSTDVNTVDEALMAAPLYDKVYKANSYNNQSIRVYPPHFGSSANNSGVYPDGASITFISDVTNNPANTTTISIRGIGYKRLYKAGQVGTYPSIITGRVYTVWYDLANDCFFVKAGGAVTLTPGTAYDGMYLFYKYDMDVPVPQSLQNVYCITPGANVEGEVAIEIHVFQDTTTPVIYKIGSNAQGTESGSTDISITETVDFSSPVYIALASPSGTNVSMESLSVRCKEENFCSGAAV